eukprot:233137_1
MSYTAQATAQERRNALMERILMRKFNAMESEYERMKNAEQRLRIKHEIQARIDKSNPKFDPNVIIEYNPQWAEKHNNDSDSEEEEPHVKSSNKQPHDNANENDRIHLSGDGIDKIKSLMHDMPLLNAPDWAHKIPEDVWKNKLLDTLQQTNDDNRIMEAKQPQPKQQNTAPKATKPHNPNKTQSKTKPRGKGKNNTKNKARNKHKKNKKKHASKGKNMKHKSKKRKK